MCSVYAIFTSQQENQIILYKKMEFQKLLTPYVYSLEENCKRIPYSNQFELSIFILRPRHRAWSNFKALLV